MKIIIVEDDAAQRTAYSDTIDSINESGDESIEIIFKDRIDDAVICLDDDDVAGVIVDLKLSSGVNDSSDGNDIIRSVVNKRRFPVFVYSANLGMIDSEISTSIFFQKFEKAGIVSLGEIINKLKIIYKTGITKILGRNGIIEKQLNKVFWDHILDVFEQLSEKGINEKQLLRYITGHLYEYLEINEVGDSFETYFPEEVYIKPPIKQIFFTGDIIEKKDDTKKYIILTPACDIANKKAKRILLAFISNIDDDPMRYLLADYNKIPEGGISGEEMQAITDKKNDAEDNLNKLLSNNYSPRYYFLPKSGSFNSGLINFQNLEIINYDSMNDDFNKIATINSQFLKDIIARFSFYYSRQGAPNVTQSIGDL